MSETKKPLSERDFQHTLRASYNDTDKSITTSSFLSAKIGHKVEKTNVSPTVEDYSFYDSGNLLYILRVTYADTLKSEFLSAERIA